MALENPTTPLVLNGPARLIQLDVLRGIAIILVLFRHPIIYPNSPGVGFWKPLFSVIYDFGWTGVDLFFVLSGFLIGGLLFQEILKTDRLDARRFLVRRAFKIWPSYLVLIAVMFVSLHFVSGQKWKLSLTKIVPNLLHIQNFVGSPRGFTWSLSVEEHFYVALPLLLLVLLEFRRRPIRALKAVPAISITLIVGCTAYRFVHNWNRPYDFFTHVSYTYLRIDGLFFGVLLAYLHHFHPASLARLASHRVALLIGGFCLLSPMIYFDHQHRFCTTFGFTFLYLGYGAIMLALLYTPPGVGILGRLLSSMPSRIVAGIGLYSYSIYLWQEDLARLPILHHLLSHLRRIPSPLYWPVVEAIHFAFALTAGILMAKLIERPSLALRDRLFPRSSSKPVAHQSGTRNADSAQARSDLPSQHLDAVGT